MKKIPNALKYCNDRYSVTFRAHEDFQEGFLSEPSPLAVTRPVSSIYWLSRRATTPSDRRHSPRRAGHICLLRHSSSRTSSTTRVPLYAARVATDSPTPSSGHRVSPAMSRPSANRPCTRQFLRLALFGFSSFFRFFFVRAKARRPRTENGPSWIAHVAPDDVPTRRQSEKGEPMCLAQFVVIKQSEVVRDSY